MSRVIKIFTTASMLFVVTVMAVSAANAPIDIPEGNPITLGGLTDNLESIVKFLVIIAGFLMVGFVIWSGLYWMYAGARGDTGKVEDAKGMLRAAIIGSLIVLGVGVILQTIRGFVSGEFFMW
ncbi:MAG: hypothetical protein KW806_03505 [Candidatus Yanofskybacteria bacterium]|nr:hypothetical protein [Candidatus Yanofskybacteria bacterium]